MIEGSKPIRVLVVDDSVDCTEMLVASLEMSGYEVRASNDSEHALRLAAEFRPRVAVLDVGLPGMDGYELARRMKAQERTPPPLLIALTGFSQAESGAQVQAAGFDAHLVKPVEIEALSAAIHRLVTVPTET